MSPSNRMDDPPAFRCSRCQRWVTVNDPELSSWAFLHEDDGEERPVCPDCLTPTEEQALFEESWVDSRCSRCGRDTSEADADELNGWLVTEDGRYICRGCATHVDRVADMKATIEGLRRAFPEGQS